MDDSLLIPGRLDGNTPGEDIVKPRKRKRAPGSYQRLDLFIKVLRVLCPNVTAASLLVMTAAVTQESDERWIEVSTRR